MTVRKYLKLEISISSFKYCKDCKAKKDKLVPSVFGRIYSAPISLRFYLTFKNPEDEGTIVEVKRLNPHHRMAPDFSKRSAQAEWQTNTNPLFRPLNENTDDGANDEPNIVSVKRSAQADWQDLPDVFRPLPQTENTIVQVKRGEDMNPFNRMADVNPFNRMAGPPVRPPSKRNKCASNSPSVVSILTFSNNNNKKKTSFMLTGSNNQFRKYEF